MAQHEEFSLNRNESIANSIDPRGRKWEIHARRGSALLYARPNPDRKDAIIPASFAGEWTKADLLRTKIKAWLEQEWNAAELASVKLDRKAAVSKKKKSEQELLDELPDEVKEAVGIE